MSVFNIQEISLPTLSDDRGDLSFLHGNEHVPFAIERLFYFYHVPSEKTRGGHAHKQLKQFMIAMHGSFRVDIDDGKNAKTFFLNSPAQGLYIPPMLWVDVSELSQNAVCLVLASHPYDENDYYRKRDEFLKAVL